MKKLLLALLIIVVLIAAALAVFIATFDANRYRPLVIEQLQKALGRPVSLERISLGWRNGIAAQLSGLDIPDLPQTEESLLKLESASVNIKLMPLLRKDVQISSVVLIKPKIHVSRDAQGKINLLGLAAIASPAAGSTQPAASGDAPVSFAVETVKIEHGTVHWTDALSQPVADLNIGDLNVTIRHIAAGQPMDVEASAAVSGARQNVQFKGRLLPPGGKAAGWIKNAQLDIDGIAIAPFLPAAGAGLPKPKGNLSTHLELDVPSLNPAQAMIGLTAQGSLQLSDFAIENFNILRALFDKMSMLPGLVSKLQSKLPPQYLNKLQANETAFEPIALPINLRQGKLALNALELKTEEARIVGQGQAGVLDQSVAMEARIYIKPDLSKAIVDGVSELGALANESGEIEIPLTIQGRIPKLAVQPDVQYLASKVIVNKAIDIIGQLLAPKQEAAPDGAVQPQAGQEQQAPATTEALVEGLLRKALKKRMAPEAPSETPQ